MHCNDDRNAQEITSAHLKRIYDSCASKDYLENLRCFFTEYNQSIVDQAINAKIKDINVLTVNVDVENLQFKNGFFSVNQTFFFKIEIEVISPSFSNFLNALCVYSKNTVLFGSKSDVRTFSSNEKNLIYDEEILPTAIVQVSKPLLLSSSLNDTRYDSEFERLPNIPNEIIEHFGGKFSDSNILKYINLSIGLFSITHIERNVQMCVFTRNSGNIKKCNNGLNSRETFVNTQFPMSDFFPTCTL